MLRPLDIAPKTVHFNSDSHELSSWLFTTDNINFLNSGSAKIVFQSIKNDTSRSGFEVYMHVTENAKLNPVDDLIACIYYEDKEIQTCC